MLYDFVDKMTHDELQHYINDICTVNCYTNSDLVIGKRIMNMTSKKYGLIKKNYDNINGLIMLAEGMIVKCELILEM